MSAKDRMAEVHEARAAYRAEVDARPPAVLCSRCTAEKLDGCGDGRGFPLCQQPRASAGSQRADEERDEATRAKYADPLEDKFGPRDRPKVDEQLTLPTGSQERKDIPLVTGLLDYFPAALAEIAKVSKAGNDKHNPGEPLHWARGKSTDQADCIGRHLLERGGIDPETGQRHSAQMAWRALALLQLELEAAGAPVARGARV